MNNDLISRQQAFDALHCRFADGFEEDRWWNSTHVISALKGLPAVPPERKMGRWIYGESEVGNDGYYCSECGNFVPWIYEESAMNFIREYKFCPNCGAKMERRQDGH